MPKSTTPRKRRKAASLPLWKHPAGYWAKKIAGKHRYFGRVADDPDGWLALEDYTRNRDRLEAGLDPLPVGAENGAMTVKRLCNAWMAFKKERLESGQPAQRSFDAYHTSAEFLIDALGTAAPVDRLGPIDFQALRRRMAKSWGPVRLKNEMGVVGQIFRYGEKAGLSNTDLALLPVKAVDLEGGWLIYARTKTAVKRIRQALASRGEPKDPADAPRLFVGPRGQSYVGGRRGARVSREFDRTAARAGVEAHSFCDCRRTFATIGEESGDRTAVSAIMGHAPRSGDMQAVYRQRVSDRRLRAVVEYVRAWLFGKGGDGDE